ncbi:MAG: NYN domain-containing protein [Luteitalea sp.]|nr:NYN domain-containing protein [Luteitalea sp.]
MDTSDAGVPTDRCERTSRLPEPRLKIAVFIDFDNIEIGVKTTLGGRFDPGAVLEAVKERGEVATKIAYGDWTRAGDYSRELTQHGIQMVQRSLTPGGDKNGADINLALDALEMAFTHSHINAFVIVGGDSDFMALVEKLKQYDRKVMVVGGRQFTSIILQRNCHEFIAYENVTRDRRPGARRGPVKNPAEGMPLVKRALKILADREVTPQLGVLKSTLLQLDPTFSEREYGVSSFRDFAERLARGGHVTLKGTDRSLHVELKEQESSGDADAASAESASDAPEVAADSVAQTEPRESTEGGPVSENGAPAGTQADGFTILRETFLRPGAVQRWPLYVRQVKQILRSTQERFDERRYGFGGIVDALRYGQREGLFRLDRDRQGVIRVYPGALFQQPSTATTAAGAPDVKEQEAEGAPGPEPLVDERETSAEPDQRSEREQTGLFESAEQAPPSEQAQPDAGGTSMEEEPTRKPTARRTRVGKQTARRPTRATSTAGASAFAPRASADKAASPSSGARKTTTTRKRARKAPQTEPGRS